MTRRGINDGRASSEPSEPTGTPPAPMASPAGSPKSLSPQNSMPSPPVMLATMTPVNAVELPKDVDHFNSEPVAMYDRHMDHNDHDPNKSPLYDHNVAISSQAPVIFSTHNLHDNDGLMLDPSSVPVVVQSGHGGAPIFAPQLYHQAGTGTAVLVVSELVEDMSPMMPHELRKRKAEDDIGRESSPPMSEPLDVSAGGGSSSSSGNSNAAASHGGHATPTTEESWRAYYDHPLTAATSAMLNISGAASEDSPTPTSHGHISFIGDIWTQTSTAGGGPLLTSSLKATNGLTSGAALDLQSTADLHGLFLAQPPQPQLVKREPEDLSHRAKQPESPPDHQPTNGIIKIAGPGHGGRHKVLLANGDSAELLDESVKDELDLAQPLEVAQPIHTSRSLTATPTSSSSPLLGEHAGPLDLISTPDGLKMAYSTQMFQQQQTAAPAHPHHGSGTPSPVPYPEHLQYAAPPQQPTSGYLAATGANLRAPPPGPVPFSISEQYYREFFGPVSTPVSTAEQSYVPLRQQCPPTYVDAGDSGAGTGSTAASSAFVERYVRHSSAYTQKGVIAAATAVGLTVDLPSPDSGIGADSITPRDQAAIQQSFDYTDLCSGQVLDPLSTRGPSSQGSPGPQGASQPAPRSRPWHDFGRQNDADKIQIPKVYSQYGFKYCLETPISTSQRREDDRVTYINKGQFYGITMEYVADPEGPMLKSHTVKSVVMLMFREEKSPEDEIKAWQFWHGRQHSVKQRILDADTKNSMGVAGNIEEVAHNAIAVYWNPLESSAKINIAVQCLSTDFSSQKGVKGLPLHIQIDTYEDPRDSTVSHRGYCQIKVFCDKGAERKTRDEERRAAKRKMTATGRKKLDELYHPAQERSEFYTMADLLKPPVFFSPSEDLDKLSSMDLQTFYGHDTDTSSVSNGEVAAKGTSPFLLHTVGKPAAQQTLKFHNHFPPDSPGVKKEHVLDNDTLTTDGSLFSPAIKRPKLLGTPHHLGTPHQGLSPHSHSVAHPGHPTHPGHSLTPPLSERVMLYVRQDSEDVYTPLHVVPPSTQGLLNAIENKYKISASSISNLYRKNKKGITVKIDDEMVKYYCNEDLFVLELKRDPEDKDLLEITLIELPKP